MSVKDFIQRGDVHRDRFPSNEQPPLYIGSGLAGGCIDGFGWMHDDFFKGDRAVHNRALHFRRCGHFYRGKHAVDMMCALYHVGYREMPRIKEEGYTQTLHLYSATVKTSYTLEDGTRVSICAFMHPKYPDVLSFVYEYEGTPQDILLSAEKKVTGHYGERWEGDFTPCENGFDVRTNMTQTKVRLRVVSAYGAAEVHSYADGICVRAIGGSGKHLISIFAGSEDCPCPEELASVDAWISSAEAAWEEAYGEAYVMIPDEFVAKMTARSLYLVVSSFSARKSAPPPPMGYSGYGWPFHFPQDVSYTHPALLRLGLLEHAKRIVEHYRESLDDMKKITHRIYGGEGAMWAWIYPMGEGDDYLRDGAPNFCYYEIHNAAYPARMAYETAMQAGDENWTREVALPIVRASAEFYASHLTKGVSGTWDLFVIPSTSQDEFAKQDSPNYLCALYAARYTFSVAVRMGLDEYATYLDDGLSFETLLDRTRMLYRTSEGMTEATWGLEKHPVQLNPLFCLPIFPLDEAEKNAYFHRADICGDTKKSFYHGWTLASFWAAASHMGDAEGLWYELHRAEDPNYLAPDGVSFYETTGYTTTPYFVTSHGFWLQAVLDAFVSDWFGTVQTESAIPKAWKGAVYHGLCTKDGKRHSGTVDGYSS